MKTNISNNRLSRAPLLALSHLYISRALDGLWTENRESVNRLDTHNIQAFNVPNISLHILHITLYNISCGT